MIWVRCAPADFDHWASLGNEGWAWNDVLPVYKAIEDYSGGASELRGEGVSCRSRATIRWCPIQAVDHRGGGSGGAGAQSGLQRRPSRRRLARAGDDARRSTGQYLDGVSQAGSRRRLDDQDGLLTSTR